MDDTFHLHRFLIAFSSLVQPLQTFLIQFMYKTIQLAAILTLSASLAQAAVTIGHVENAGTGFLMDFNNNTPTAGQVVVGKFTTAPSALQWSTYHSNLETGVQTVAQVFSDLVTTFGFTDVRSLGGAGSGDQGGFDWDWNVNTTIAGTTNVNFGNLGASQPLYLLAYNGTTTATSTNLFAGKATTWTSPSTDGPGTTLLLSAIDTASEILIGFDTGGANVRMQTAVPEPSRLILMGIAGMGLMLRRRRC